MRRRGVALLFVMGVITLLSAIAASLHRSTMGAWKLARREADRARAEAVAMSGLTLAEELLKIDNRPYFWFPAGENPIAPDGTQVALSELEEAYLELSRSQEDPRQLDDLELSVSIQDEGGFFNLNRAPAGHIKRLLLVHGVSVPEDDEEGDKSVAQFTEELTAALIDWRDPDDNISPYGAERNHYEQLEPVAYRPRNGPLLSREELRLIKGFSKEVLGKPPSDEENGGEAEPRSQESSDEEEEGEGREEQAPEKTLLELVTVHGILARANVNSAPRQVLEAVPGIFESAARAEVVAALVENRPYRDRQKIRSIIFTVDPVAAPQAIAWLDVRSDYFRIRSEARVPGSAVAGAEVVVRRLPGGRMQRVGYREY